MTGAPQADWNPADLLGATQTNWDLVHILGASQTNWVPQPYWEPLRLAGAPQTKWGPAGRLGPRISTGSRWDRPRPFRCTESISDQPGPRKRIWVISSQTNWGPADVLGPVPPPSTYIPDRVWGKVGILAVFWSFWGPEDYILFQENILPVFRSLSNPKSLALRALDFVHSSTPNHWSANPWHT